MLITILSPVGSHSGFVQVTNGTTGKKASELLKAHDKPEVVAVKAGNAALKAGVKFEVSDSTIKIFGKNNMISFQDVFIKSEEF